MSNPLYSYLIDWEEEEEEQMPAVGRRGRLFDLARRRPGWGTRDGTDSS
jgi:hypothetical protein